MSFGGIKRTPADAAFSDCVREAHDYTCQNCGINLRHNPRAMHLSHFYGRRSKSTRWAKENGFCLCAGCHNWMGEHPHEHSQWVQDQLGDGLFEILTVKAREIFKYNKEIDKEVARHYRKQLKEMQELRRGGVAGVLFFESYQ